MVADPETRKAIAQRAIDRAAACGTPIDHDPAFLGLLNEWIRGDIEFKDMRTRYLHLLALQAAERRGRSKSRIDQAPGVASIEQADEQ